MRMIEALAGEMERERSRQLKQARNRRHAVAALAAPRRRGVRWPRRLEPLGGTGR